jgi:hypothetical protein
MQSLLSQAQTELDLQNGGYSMLIPDMPNVPNQAPSIVLVAQNNQVTLDVNKTERVLGVCEIIENEKRLEANGDVSVNYAGIYPPSSAEMYLVNYEHRSDLTIDDVAAAKTTVLQQPKHGILKDDTLMGSFWYIPESGYVGKDSAEILVEIKGVKVKIQYFIHATEYNEPNAYENYCEQSGGQWKISRDANGNPILVATGRGQF